MPTSRSVREQRFDAHEGRSAEGYALLSARRSSLVSFRSKTKEHVDGNARLISRGIGIGDLKRTYKRQILVEKDTKGFHSKTKQQSTQVQIRRRRVP